MCLGEVVAAFLVGGLASACWLGEMIRRGHLTLTRVKGDEEQKDEKAKPDTAQGS